MYLAIVNELIMKLILQKQSQNNHKISIQITNGKIDKEIPNINTT